MEENKNKDISSLLGIIIILLVIIIIGLILYMFYKPNNNSNTTNNNDSTDNNVINENDNTNDKVITSDHITNDKVQEIYDVVSLEQFTTGEYVNYDTYNFIDNLYNKIVIALRVDDLKFSALTDEQKNYVINNVAKNNNLYYGDVVTEVGYITMNTLNEKLESLFNIKINNNDLNKIFYPNVQNQFTFGCYKMFLYDENLNGFLSLSPRCGGNMNHYNSKIYNYIENDEKAYVDTVYAYLAHCNSQSSDKWCAYKNYSSWYNGNKDDKSAIYTDLTDEDYDINIQDKDKFMKLRYTFNKRTDGTYYFANVEEIN